MNDSSVLEEAMLIILNQMVKKEEEIKDLEIQLKILKEKNSQQIEKCFNEGTKYLTDGLPLEVCAMYSKWPNCMIILDISVLKDEIEKLKQEIAEIDFDDSEYEEITSLNKLIVRLQQEKEDALQIKIDYEKELEDLKKGCEDEKIKLRKEIANYSN